MLDRHYNLIGIASEKREARIRGGVAQLGEHLPCKQGVKSSNLSVSIVDVIKLLQSALYLENFIQMI